MRPRINLFLFLITIAVTTLSAQVYKKEGALTAESTVDWTKNIFSSRLALDMRKADLAFPGGKSAALSAITSQVTSLLKDPVFSLTVNADSQLGDLVAGKSLDMEILLQAIDQAYRSAGNFNHDGNTLVVDHRITINNLSSLLVKHRSSYQPKIPIDQVSTRPYTGILIDARGLLPVHGEFISERGRPCFFPRIWDENMDIVYERGMMDGDLARKEGLVRYDYSNDEDRYTARIGTRPLRVTARQIFGHNFTDPVISRTDALRILSEPQNLRLLKEGRVVILLDEDVLVHKVAFPQKDAEYWVHYREVQTQLVERIPDVGVEDTPPGIQISVQNLRFVANESTLLPEEALRLNAIADSLRSVFDDNRTNDYTIRVDGHAADIGEAEGELRLSTERAQAIVNAMVARGLDASLFTWFGHGASEPRGDNTTDEGRALNRRVEITAVPRTVYVQRF
jgi:outer membrane protein OmpA-like peptidoglycan-associated protein